MEKFSFRPATLLDEPFIHETFYEGFKDSPWRGDIRPSDLLAPVLKSWWVTICTLTDVPDQIIGFVIWSSSNDIAWIATRPAAWRHGAMTAMLKHIGTDMTKEINAAFATPVMMNEAKKRGIRLRFRPYMVCQ